MNIYNAARSGNIKRVEDLIKSGTPLFAQLPSGKNILHIAAEKGHCDLLNALLSKKPDVNQADNVGITSLHYAADNGHLKCVEALIKAGADINKRGYAGATALYEAAMGGHKSVVELLLKAGADPSITNNGGVTPLNAATRRGHFGIGLTLVEAGANRGKSYVNLINKGAAANISYGTRKAAVTAAALGLYAGGRRRTRRTRRRSDSMAQRT